MLLLAAFPTRSEPFRLKGLEPGLTKQQIEQIHPGATATCLKPEKTTVCYYAPGASLKDAPSLDTYAGFRVSRWTLIFRNETLEALSVSLPSGAFEDLIGYYAKQHGQPHCGSSQVQNALGAKFDQRICEWRADGVALTARKRSSSITQMEVSLTSEESARRREREAAEAGKADL